ncbi:hypothetical protein N0V83_005194 [Neocucurbitaria cava]|uniref:Uncharacterized protein n=1 Tax=Neocucurbitaria cava TaxID=798079 RepID=A0A9W8YBF6_9PLEO|nr:hypothetical protein N0V83_005194 [Neocucurbitaria cava]
MKVAEKASDRTAEVHIRVEGQAKALKEYGEYISSEDKAICCYVPVEEGDTIKIEGVFSGTTLAIAYDAVVDGVFRKANSYTAKAVLNMKRKTDVTTFLYKTDKGIIDTDMLVTQLPECIVTQLHEKLETIGTVELRLYVTRQLGVSHIVRTGETYYAPRNNIEETASYKQIAPVYQMGFEQDSALLGKGQSTREQRKSNAPRPGTEPWAIFRFHYRSEDAIADKHMKPTFNPSDKKNTKTQILVHDPVPPLLAGVKPPKDDGDSSTRASSPIPPNLPSTPIKSAYRKRATESTTSINKQLNTPATPVTTMASTTENVPVASPDTSLIPETNSVLNEDLGAPKPPPEEPASAKVDGSGSHDPKDISATAVGGHMNKASELANDIVTSDQSIETEHGKAADADKATGPLAKPIKKNTVTNKATDKITDKAIDKAIDKVIDKVIDKDTTTVIPRAKAKATDSTKASATKGSTPAKNGAKVTDGDAAKIAPQPDGTLKKPPRALKVPVEEQNSKPMATKTPTSVTQSVPAPPTTAVTPTKRSCAPANGTSPEIKRAKIAPTLAPPVPSQSPVPSTSTKLSPTYPGSPSPKPMSIERQVTEQRKKLEELRKKRLEMATKQSSLDQEMAPYKQRMAEELERLNQETMAEENAYAEEEEHYSASIEILAEFMSEDLVAQQPGFEGGLGGHEHGVRGV